MFQTVAGLSWIDVQWSLSHGPGKKSKWNGKGEAHFAVRSPENGAKLKAWIESAFPPAAGYARQECQVFGDEEGERCTFRITDVQA